MSEDVLKKAQATTAQVKEIEATALLEPTGEIVPLNKAKSPQKKAIRARMQEIDLSDTNSIIGFGSDAQTELQEISQAMLTGVRNKDAGPAGDTLREMVTTLRGFPVSDLNVRHKRSWWERLTGKLAPMAQFIARYEDLQSQIDRIADNLVTHEHTLLQDIQSLDTLYEKTLAFYDELALYIAAGQAWLDDLDSKAIPAGEAAVETATDAEKTLAAQELRDLRTTRDDLERRVHDLKLTRQVTMQSLPSIRLVQENDKSLVSRINSTLVNTIPLWETQLAQAVTIQRSTEAARAVRDAGNLTNDLLTANAANLREGNRIIREEVERGVFDIEAIRAAHTGLIETIEDSLQIADEAKIRRASAEAELVRMEDELRTALVAAKARRPAAD